MATETSKLKLPRPESTDFHNLENFQALIDAMDSGAQKNITMSGTAPSSPATNDVWLDTTAHAFKRYDGTAWVKETPTAAADIGAEPSFSKNSAFNKNFGTASGTVAEGNHNHSGTYEPAFTKNSAFNKNFGTAAGTVAEGNHTHNYVSKTGDAMTGMLDLKAQASGASLVRLSHPSSPAAAGMEIGFNSDDTKILFNVEYSDAFKNAIDIARSSGNIVIPNKLSVEGMDVKSAIDGKEPAFTKNSAFNKNFGTASGTVAEGNHTHDYPVDSVAGKTGAVTLAKGDVGLGNVDNVQQETPDGARKKVEQTNYKTYKSGKDANGIFTTVEYKRADDTLAIKSVLSGGTSPEYTTRTVDYYDLAGTNIEKTTTYSLSYDADGDLTSEV